MLPATLNQPPLALLSEALADYAKGYQSPFLVKVIHALFEQVATDNPQAIELPNGRSILVEAYHAAPALGFRWWQLRGPLAWQPTTATPQPLIELVSRHPKATYSRDRFWPIDRMVHGVATARRFLEDGLRHAMPVSHAELAAWPADQRPDRDLRARLRHQQLLVDFCLRAHVDCDLSPSHKLRALVELGGALPVACFGTYQAGELIDHYPDGLFAPVVHTDRFGKKDGQPVITAFHEYWAGLSDPPRLEPALARLKRAGISCQGVEQTHAIDQLLALVIRHREKRVSPMHSWGQLSDELDVAPGGWQLANDHGLVWQQLLAKRPELLYHALSHPGVDWQARSPNGLGVWDHLDVAICQGILPSTHLTRLATRCPPSLAPTSTPLLWASWWEEPQRAQAFFRETARSHPAFWLGSPKQQWLGAIGQITRLLDDSDTIRTHAVLAMNLLWDPALDRDRLSPDLKTVMAVFQRAVRHDPDTLAQMPNLKANPLSEEGLPPPNRKLLDYLHRKIQKPGEDPQAQRARWLQDACMEVFTPPSAPRRGRAHRL